MRGKKWFVPIPVMIAFAFAGSTMYFLIVGPPTCVTNFIFRPQFMIGCTRGRLDNATLKYCSDEYARWRAVVNNGWRPTK